MEAGRIGRARFWAEVDFPRTDCPTNNPLSPLSAAAKVGSMDMYELLIQHGADESAWKDLGNATESSMHHSWAPSRWAVEPPLWVAIQNQDLSMIRYLLHCGHKLDLFPEALVTRSWNALTYALASGWMMGFASMAPPTDMSFLSPTQFVLHQGHSRKARPGRSTCHPQSSQNCSGPRSAADSESSET